MDNQELLKNLHQRDLIYRTMQFIIIVILIAGFAVTLFIQESDNAQILDGIKTQNTRLQRAVNDLKKDNSLRLDQQNKYIQCIADFFARTDRSNIVISNLDECLIKPVDQSAISLPLTSPTSNPAQQGQSIASGPVSTPPAKTSPSPAPQSKHLLCIPLTALCIN